MTKPPVIAVPNQLEWDDVTALWLRKVPTPRWPGLVGEAAERLATEGGRSFTLWLHPWVIGQPHRIRYLSDAIARLLAIPRIWYANAAEIAEAARRSWNSRA